MKLSELQFDHVHVFVSDRPAAVAWYERVLHLRPAEALLSWARGGGPLTLADAADRVHLALFEGQSPAPRRATVALGVDGAGFVAWRDHLTEVLGEAPRFEDHRMAWSLYFRDLDGNPYEITTYDVAQAAARMVELSQGDARPAPRRP
jgi:catechol 2,3-dioxygenase-like lactoylglutathione lyase family enzyme